MVARGCWFVDVDIVRTKITPALQMEHAWSLYTKLLQLEKLCRERVVLIQEMLTCFHVTILLHQPTLTTVVTITCVTQTLLLLFQQPQRFCHLNQLEVNGYFHTVNKTMNLLKTTWRSSEELQDRLYLKATVRKNRAKS